MPLKPKKYGVYMNINQYDLKRYMDTPVVEGELSEYNKVEVCVQIDGYVREMSLKEFKAIVFPDLTLG